MDSGCTIVGEGARGRQTVRRSRHRRASQHEGKGKDETEGPHLAVSGPGIGRRSIGPFDNDGLFPDICATSEKWFRHLGELFRRGGCHETLGQKAQSFQRALAAAIGVVGRWPMMPGSLAELGAYSGGDLAAG